MHNQPLIIDDIEITTTEKMSHAEFVKWALSDDPENGMSTVTVGYCVMPDGTRRDIRDTHIGTEDWVAFFNQNPTTKEQAQSIADFLAMHS